MKYLDNLIAWGDHLFRQDTIESINEATQLYVLAAEILGPRPRRIPPRASRRRADATSDLAPRLDAFGNALVERREPGPAARAAPPRRQPTRPRACRCRRCYFCIPRNDKLLGYWDTVADRLFKIRHCMNIEGVVRQLRAVRAADRPGGCWCAPPRPASTSAACSRDAARRCRSTASASLVAKAAELCGEVRALGAALLAALEKRDAEALALLRSTQEIEVLDAVRDVRPARRRGGGAQPRRARADARARRPSGATTTPDSRSPTAARRSTSRWPRSRSSSRGWRRGWRALAGALSLIPNVKLGAPALDRRDLRRREPRGVAAGVRRDGRLDGLAAAVWRQALALTAPRRLRAPRRGVAPAGAPGRQGARAGSPRSSAAAELRAQIAEHELANHDLQIENAAEATSC